MDKASKIIARPGHKQVVGKIYDENNNYPLISNQRINK